MCSIKPSRSGYTDSTNNYEGTLNNNRYSLLIISYSKGVILDTDWRSAKETICGRAQFVKFQVDEEINEELRNIIWKD